MALVTADARAQCVAYIDERLVIPERPGVLSEILQGGGVAALPGGTTVGSLRWARMQPESEGCANAIGRQSFNGNEEFPVEIVRRGPNVVSWLVPERPVGTGVSLECGSDQIDGIDSLVVSGGTPERALRSVDILDVEVTPANYREPSCAIDGDVVGAILSPRPQFAGATVDIPHDARRRLASRGRRGAPD